jgi:hypothetical protein
MNIDETIQKNSKFKYTYYHNTHTIVKTPPRTHTHTQITKPVQTTTVQGTHHIK